MSSPSHLYAPVDRPNWNNMADAPERYYPPEGIEAAHGYYPPQAKSDSAPQVAYADTDVNGKEAVAFATPTGGDIEGGKKGAWRNKRLCGLPILTALVVGVIVILAIIGGVVGGVVGSKAGKSNVAESDGAAAVEDKTTSSGVTLQEPTTTASNGISSTSTSSSAAPTRTQACPEFAVDVRSDYWHTVTVSLHSPSNTYSINQRPQLTFTASELLPRPHTIHARRLQSRRQQQRNQDGTIRLHHLLLNPGHEARVAIPENQGASSAC